MTYLRHDSKASQVFVKILCKFSQRSPSKTMRTRSFFNHSKYSMWGAAELNAKASASMWGVSRQELKVNKQQWSALAWSAEKAKALHAAGSGLCQANYPVIRAVIIRRVWVHTKIRKLVRGQAGGRFQGQGLGWRWEHRKGIMGLGGLIGVEVGGRDRGGRVGRGN